MALTSSPEQALPVRTVARAMADWVGRLGRVWVEGQVTQLRRRPGMTTAFLTLRDPVAEVSLQVTCPSGLCEGFTPPLAEGARIVVFARPEVHLARGTLSLVASEIRPVGLGALLARLEQLKKTLAAEGLFAAERKQALPFLPARVGLITGRASAAERDVVENARRRWRAVQFEVREVAVQGPGAVPALLRALADLDADPRVDVIVIARGGGSVEDLLPFSDEALLRAVARCRAPVVSAIGHEQDVPLLDLVADVRASTPTDAGRRVVPDVAEEQQRVERARTAIRRAVAQRVEREQSALAALLARPCLADPAGRLEVWAEGVLALLARARRCWQARLTEADREVEGLAAAVRALSPAATLERGYSVLLRDGHALRSHTEASPGEVLLARLSDGALSLEVLAAP